MRKNREDSHGYHEDKVRSCVDCLEISPSKNASGMPHRPEHKHVNGEHHGKGLTGRGGGSKNSRGK